MGNIKLVPFGNWDGRHDPDRIGSDRIGLDWIELDWIGLVMSSNLRSAPREDIYLPT